VHAHDLDGRELQHVSSIGRVRLYDARAGALAVAHTTGRLRCTGQTPAGAEPAPGTPEQFAELLRQELAKYQQVVKFSGARVD
jgi:hypothetical protein